MTAHQVDAIVLGGGTMGSAAAWALGKRGLSAIVLEQFKHVHGFGSHGGLTRIIRHAYAEGPAYVPLVLRADQLWRELEAVTGHQVLHRTGGLEMAAPGYDHARSVRISAIAHDLPFEWLTPAEVRARWPVWRIDDDWEVCFTPGAGFLATEPALQSLRQAAETHGVTFHEGEPARSWSEINGQVEVQTDRGRYRADRLIITAGAWASEMLAGLGLPLTVVRKTLWWLELDDPAQYGSDQFPIFITESDAGSIYGFPLFEQPGLKIARHTGGEPTTPDTVVRETRDEEKAAVVPFATRRLTGVRDRVLDSAVCLYTMTPDEHFILDRVPGSERVVFGAGFSGHGFKFATAIGEHLVQLALEEDVMPFQHLGIHRFVGNAR